MADGLNSSGSRAPSPDKGGETIGSVRRVMQIVEPFDELSEVTCNQDVIGSLLSLAQTEIEDHESGRYYTVGNARPLRRLSHLLYAIEILHDQEMRRVCSAEEGLFRRGVPSMLRAAA